MSLRYNPDGMRKAEVQKQFAPGDRVIAHLNGGRRYGWPTEVVLISTEPCEWVGRYQGVERGVVLVGSRKHAIAGYGSTSWSSRRIGFAVAVKERGSDTWHCTIAKHVLGDPKEHAAYVRRSKRLAQEALVERQKNEAEAEIQHAADLAVIKPWAEAAGVYVGQYKGATVSLGSLAKIIRKVAEGQAAEARLAHRVDL